ncbi:MAG: DUF4164 domain-containing protein [Methylobacteriaceae bacterium]|jgi:uncharacterized protein YicC (UPF0701 family)|nr:DUF4164 domain-containing protein [Methylobacteriaceae bacterium]
MSTSVDSAVTRLMRAVALLESAVRLKAEVEQRRGDVELELQLMQDDRERLAEELNGSFNRLTRMESVVGEVAERVDRAAATIEDVLHISGKGGERHDR